MKHIFEKLMTRAVQKYNFIGYGQVFQKLWQYRCNLTTFWHGFLPNMVIMHLSQVSKELSVVLLDSVLLNSAV